MNATLTAPSRAAVMRPLAAVDAMWYWYATKFLTDQFLVYAFAGTPPTLDRAVDQVLERARLCPDLRLRIAEPRLDLRSPQWISCDVVPEQIVVHPLEELEERSWSACLDALVSLSGQQLDPRHATWRLHVFTGVLGVPAGAGSSAVVALQISHALGDGLRAAALAGYLFGRKTAPPALAPRPPGRLIHRAVEAHRAHRQLVRDTEAGLIPPPKQAAPALSTNNRPTGKRVLRTVLRRPSELPGPTITVGVLVAVSEALSGYLRDRGEDVSKLTAEVPMVKPGVRHSHNHFGSVGIGLYPDTASRQERAGLIAGDIQNCRRRRLHPAFVADELAFAAVPAALRRWGVSRLDADRRSPTVMGNTVVSSVNRGAADLNFGGCPVIQTSGYPALSPMMGLTHGVHGIGDSVAISVNTTESIIADIDGYLDRLNAALRP